LANTKQATKRAKQAEKHRQNNRWQHTRFNTQLKKVLVVVTEGNTETAKTTYQETVSIIDRMANKGLIHKNKAARHKSRLNKRLKAMAAA
jgi:small subunit ribosomal protein S20